MSAGQRDMSAGREQLMHDTLRLAICFEGGSNHWLRAETYTDGEHIGATGCRDAKDSALDNVTLATIELGFRRLIDGSVTARSDIVAEARRAFLDPDDGAIDAAAADVILQAGLLGAVVYRRKKA